MAEPDEVALVAAATDGDKAAFAALVVRHRPMLLAVCRRALGDAELAEEEVERLPADAAQIVTDRQAEWERSRAAMAKAREHDT